MNPVSIVVVDDEPSIRTYLSHLLSNTGYAVETMTDGDQLLARLAVGPIPSLILLDVRLPGRDGIEIIEKINEAHLKVPVIMLSGMSQTKTVVEAMKLGASDFLLKPINEDLLVAAIQNVI